VAYANRATYYNADILSDRLKRAEHEKDAELVDRIKHINPTPWIQINICGEYRYR